MSNTTKYVKNDNQPIILENELIPCITSALEYYCGSLRNGGDEDALKIVDKLEELILNLKEYVN